MSIWGPNRKIGEEKKGIKPTYASNLKSQSFQGVVGKVVWLPKECRLYLDFDGGWHEKILLPEGEIHKLITIAHEATRDSVILNTWTDMAQDLTLKKGDVVTFLFTWRKWSRISHFRNQI